GEISCANVEQRPPRSIRRSTARPLVLVQRLEVGGFVCRVAAMERRAFEPLQEALQIHTLPSQSLHDRQLSAVAGLSTVYYDGRDGRDTMAYTITSIGLPDELRKK